VYQVLNILENKEFKQHKKLKKKTVKQILNIE